MKQSLKEGSDLKNVFLKPIMFENLAEKQKGINQNYFFSAFHKTNAFVTTCFKILNLKHWFSSLFHIVLTVKMNVFVHVDVTSE